MLALARDAGCGSSPTRSTAAWSTARARAPSFHDVMAPDDKILFVQTLSKNWAMTGWRIGWLEAPPALGAGDREPRPIFDLRRAGADAARGDRGDRAGASRSSPRAGAADGVPRHHGARAAGDRPRRSGRCRRARSTCSRGSSASHGHAPARVPADRRGRRRRGAGLRLRARRRGPAAAVLRARARTDRRGDAAAGGLAAALKRAGVAPDCSTRRRGAGGRRGGRRPRRAGRLALRSDGRRRRARRRRFRRAAAEARAAADDPARRRRHGLGPDARRRCIRSRAIRFRSPLLALAVAGDDRGVLRDADARRRLQPADGVLQRGARARSPMSSSSPRSSDADLARVAVIQVFRIFVLMAVVPLVARVGVGAANLRFRRRSRLGHGGPAGAGGAVSGFALERLGTPNGMLYAGIVVSRAAHGVGLGAGAARAGPADPRADAGRRLGRLALHRLRLAAAAPARRSPPRPRSWPPSPPPPPLPALAAALTGVPFADALVAFAPGGLEAMTMMAFALGLDPLFVGAHHIARFLFISLALPWVARADRPSLATVAPRRARARKLRRRRRPALTAAGSHTTFAG